MASACDYTPSVPLAALAGGISPLGLKFCNYLLNSFITIIITMHKSSHARHFYRMVTVIQQIMG